MNPTAPTPPSLPCDPAVSPARGARSIRPADLQALTQAALGDDINAARVLCSRLREQGTPLRDLLADLFTPVARHLGELWSNDTYDFVQVTIASSLLQRLVLEIAPEAGFDIPADIPTRRIMLVPVPGSQHTLGLLVLSRHFQLAGWAVWTSPSMTLAELREQVGRTWFDVIGFSIGSQLHAPQLADAISAARASSVNPEVRVLVGGPALIADDTLGQSAGADGAALDAEGAVRMARALLEQARSPELAS